MSCFQTNVTSLIKALLKAQLTDRDPQRAASFLAEDVIWLGTREETTVNTRAQALSYFIAEAEANPRPYALEFFDGRENSIAEGGVAVLRAEAKREDLCIPI